VDRGVRSLFQQRSVSDLRRRGLGRYLLRLAGIFSVVAGLALVVPVALVQSAGAVRVYDEVEAVQYAPVAIVFGAAVRHDGKPSTILADRVAAAVDLYKAGKVRRILMTGDNSSLHYNEASAMKRLAVELGVPADRVNLDYAGFRTYDSVYRAREVFGVTDAILVTQGYHLPRALFLARSIGIDAAGFKAGLELYPHQSYYSLRELPAGVVAWYQANVFHPRPRFLGEPVDLESQDAW
jgi:vancomycin permeability regulator SanA